MKLTHTESGYCVKSAGSELIPLPTPALAIEAAENRRAFSQGRLVYAGPRAHVAALSHGAGTCTLPPLADQPWTYRDKQTGERIVTIHPYFPQANLFCICSPKIRHQHTERCWQRALTEAQKLSDEFAGPRGLVATVSRKSWYYPGSTFAVVYQVVEN
jgi:hypothetical protein